MRIVDDSNAETREVIAAAKALLSAGKLNLENISVAVKAIEYLDLEGRVRELEQMDEEERSREAYARSCGRTG